jgi:hypothetical protein
MSKIVQATWLTILTILAVASNVGMVSERGRDAVRVLLPFFLRSRAKPNQTPPPNGLGVLLAPTL